jgi:hypothetical protein
MKREWLTTLREWEELTASQYPQVIITNLSQLAKRERSPTGILENPKPRQSSRAALIEESQTNS